MAYATVEDVANGWRALTASEEERAEYLLEDAATIIDAAYPAASDDAKNYASKAMVRRVLAVDDAVPYESTTVTAGPYTRSYTLGGTNGGLYLTSQECRLLRGTAGAVGFAQASLGAFEVSA